MLSRGALHRSRFVLSLASLGLALLPIEPSAFAEEAGSDLAEARALFERNLDAIRQRDREAYLSCYLESPELARTGPDGPLLGYESFAAGAGQAWPDHFDAQDLRLVPVAPGVVYGTYRYRVRYGQREVAGLSERVFLVTEEGWKIAVTTAFEAPAGTAPPVRALVGATLIDGTGRPPVPDASVLLQGGKITCAGSRDGCPVPAGAEVTPLAGYWITPGVVDAHVHFSQTGWADGRPDALDVRDRYPYTEVVAAQKAHPERYYRSDLCSGVTAVFDVGGYPWTWDLRAPAESDTLAPHVAAAGPLLSTWDFWLNLPGERQFLFLADEKAAAEGVGYLATRGTDAVKVWFIPVQERDFAEMEQAVLAAGREAEKAGLPLIVHATGLREAKVALRAGAHLLVHSVWDQEVDDEFLRLAREAGALYCPTLTVPWGYQRMFEAASTGEPPVLDDPNGCLDPSVRARVLETAELGSGARSAEVVERRRGRTEERQRIGELNLKKVAAAGIPIAMGTDAGNPLTLHGPSVYAEMEAMQHAGMTPMEVLVASTLGGARAMGREKDLGTVEAGKAADLLVLAADPTADISALRHLRWVVKGGELRSLEELQSLAAGAGSTGDD